MVKNNQTTKKCPHCKEEVLIDARKCKHCGEWLVTKETKKGIEDVALRQPNEETKKTSNGGFIGLIIILIIVFLFMSWPTRFMIFAFLSFVALLIGLTEPDRFKKLIKKPTRKNIGLVFGCAVLVFLVLFGITTPKNPTIAFNDFNDSSKEVTVGNFDIKGKVSPAGSAIKIKKDNKTYITTSKPDKNGNFTYNVDLNEGDNNFSFTADNHGKTFSISKKLVRKLSQEEIAKKEADAKIKADEEAKAKADADAKAKADADAAAKAKATPVPQTDNQNISPESSETTSQKNAVKSAKSYLGYTAFSHDGLVAQLEYEQFSHADAVYGADNSGANWNEQAAKSAKQYMDYSSFSRGSLIAQLEYDKFTQEQAEYGANAVGI